MKLVVSTVLFGSVLAVGSALGAEPSGETVAVVQATSASGPGGNRTLAAEQPIYSGDTIETNAIGTAQIRFRDNTRFVVGPRSSVVIDKYIFNPDNSLASVSLKMSKGAFRFISGNGPKKNYEITTPTATIGIRGTRLDVAVDALLGTGVLVFNGAVELCNQGSGECTVVRSGCGAAVALPNGQFRSANSPSAKAALIRSAFPLAESQQGLRQPFRVNTGFCGVDAGAPQGDSKPGPSPSSGHGGNKGGNHGGNHGGNEGGNEGGNYGGNEGGNYGGNEGGNYGQTF